MTPKQWVSPFISSHPAFASSEDYHRFAEPGSSTDSPASTEQNAVDMLITRFPVKGRAEIREELEIEPSSQRLDETNAAPVRILNWGTQEGRKLSLQKYPRQLQNRPQTPASHKGLPSRNVPTRASSSRYDSSLGLLTKKFLDLIKQADDGVLDLNIAADTLNVQKRRIYDITNVLEGIGLIEKKLKNIIQWKGAGLSRPGEANEEVLLLEEEVKRLRMEEATLDDQIKEMSERLRFSSEDENNKRWLFVTEEDIKNLPCFQNETLIAIKAPHGTTLEVPDPDEVVEYPRRHYQMILSSTTGPIDVYLVSRFEQKFEEINSEMPVEAVDPIPGDSMPNHIAMIQEGGIDNEMGHIGDVDPSLHSGFDSPQDSVGGIMRIVPTEVNADSDYWLLSDAGIGITDMWKSDSCDSMWDDVVRLDPSEFEASEQGSLTPPAPPSGSGAADATIISSEES